jgi:hypothetical protein
MLNLCLNRLQIYKKSMEKYTTNYYVYLEKELTCQINNQDSPINRYVLPIYSCG